MLKWCVVMILEAQLLLKKSSSAKPENFIRNYLKEFFKPLKIQNCVLIHDSRIKFHFLAVLHPGGDTFRLSWKV